MEIYLITNLVNGKKYVGQSRYNNPNYYGSGLIIKQAITKYGKSKFKKEILWSGNVAQERLDKLEISYIIEENTLYPNGYNISKGGYNGFNNLKYHPNREAIIEKLKQSMLASNKCKRPFALNGRYKHLPDEVQNKIYLLYNNGVSVYKILPIIQKEFQLDISRKKIESVIREGSTQNLILNNDDRINNHNNLEYRNILQHIEKYGGNKIGLISYIQRETGWCRKFIRNLLKKYNLYSVSR